MEDFFAAGLGFDIGGAYFLARGVIATPADLTRLSGSFWGSNRYAAVSAARDKIDATTGLAALGAGFLLQGAGYVLSLATSPVADVGAEQAITAGGFLVMAALAVVLLGWLHRRARLAPVLIEMSRYLMDGTRMVHPRAALLPGWAEAAGYRREEGESDLAFAQRTLGIKDLVVDVTGGRRRLASEPPLEGEQP